MSDKECIDQIKDILEAELSYDSVVRISRYGDKATCFICKRRDGTRIFTIDNGGFYIVCELCLDILKSELVKYPQVEVK